MLSLRLPLKVLRIRKILLLNKLLPSNRLLVEMKKIFLSLVTMSDVKEILKIGYPSLNKICNKLWRILPALLPNKYSKSVWKNLFLLKLLKLLFLVSKFFGLARLMKVLKNFLVMNVTLWILSVTKLRNIWVSSPVCVLKILTVLLKELKLKLWSQFKSIKRILLWIWSVRISMISNGKSKQELLGRLILMSVLFLLPIGILLTHMNSWVLRNVYVSLLLLIDVILL